MGIHYTNISLLIPYENVVHITHIVHLNPIWLGFKVPLGFACMYLWLNVHHLHWMILCIHCNIIDIHNYSR